MQLTAPMPGCVKPRDAWQYSAGPFDLNSGTEQLFDIPARGPLGAVWLRLLCITANNGYEAGEEIDLQQVYLNDGGNDNGAPRWSWRVQGTQLKFIMASGSIAIVDSAGAKNGTFTPAEWQLKIYALA